LDISVVVPVFNEEESLDELCEWIDRVCTSHGLSYEVILIDDGSADASWHIMSKISVSNPNIRGFRFNRNYGKSAALNTGFKEAEGEVVITMDADLQDSPDEIPELYDMVTKHGFDLVSGWKKKRHDPISKTIPSRFFNFVTGKISGIKLHDFNCGLKAYRKLVVKNISVYGEMHRYIPVIAKWQGFNHIGEKIVTHRPRKYGITKFGFERFIFGFLDLLSVTFVSRYRKSPMHFFGTMGTLSFIAGFIIAVGIIGRKLWGLYHKLPVRDVVDQPLFFLALVALIIGVQLFLTGFIAEMFTLHAEKDSKYLIVEQTRHHKPKPDKKVS
jgi:glycosyltransferase involved in cell wall biosynthesis